MSFLLSSLLLFPIKYHVYLSKREIKLNNNIKTLSLIIKFSNLYKNN